MSSPKRRAPRRQRSEQLAERLGLDLQLGDAGAFAGNAQKFNVHVSAERQT